MLRLAGKIFERSRPYSYEVVLIRAPLGITRERVQAQQTPFGLKILGCDRCQSRGRPVSNSKPPMKFSIQLPPSDPNCGGCTAL